MDDSPNNPLLAALHDIHAAPAPSWWPPAPGWWLLALTSGVILASLVPLLRRWFNQWQRRRGVLAELALLRERCQHDNGYDPHRYVVELSILLKRAALSRYPRQDVAMLNAGGWLAFLDRTGGDGQFSKPPGTALAQAPYAASNGTLTVDVDALHALAQHWLKRNF